jgi:hypothetical protein
MILDYSPHTHVKYVNSDLSYLLLIAVNQLQRKKMCEQIWSAALNLQIGYIKHAYNAPQKFNEKSVFIIRN